MLFRKKEEKRVIELTAAEVRLLREGLMCFHNKCLHDGKPTEEIADLLQKVMKR